MMHYLSYIDLVWLVGIALGAFRLLSQFAIKMIAIFAKEKFSDRAFEVLKLRRRKHRAAMTASKTSDELRSPRSEVEGRGQEEAETDIPLAAGNRSARPSGRRSAGQDHTRWGV
jgi:hypothetical protein